MVVKNTSNEKPGFSSSRAPKKKNAVVLHKDGECDCFDNSIRGADKRCIYRSFPDSWEFVTDAGNSQSRGEVFTPRWVVDRMMVMVELFDAEVVHDQKYDIDTQRAMESISARVVEPAVGTANYSSSILFNKLKLVEHVSRNSNGKLNKLLYMKNFLTAVCSVYTFDIDAGNVEVSIRRMLGQTSTAQFLDLEDEKVVEEWSNRIFSSMKGGELKKAVMDKGFSIEEFENLMIQKIFKKDETERPVDITDITAMVSSSMREAKKHWQKFLDANPEGLCCRMYREATGEEMPDTVRSMIYHVMVSNNKVFNGIEEFDTVKEGFVVPGSQGVVWNWWKVGINDKKQLMLKSEEQPMAFQCLSSEALRTEHDIEDMYKKYTDVHDNDSQTHPTTSPVPSQNPVFPDKKTELKYKNLQKNLKIIQERKEKFEKIFGV